MKTAVQTLIENLYNHEHHIDILDVAQLNGYFEQALKAEKEQIEALEKHIEELNIDKLLDDFHEWIELNEWEFCPVSFNGAIKYRWSNETYSQATTKELYEMFLSQK